MENATVWITIAVYVAVMMIIGIVSGRKSKSIADLTVGGRNAGAWLSALSYGTAYFSAVMFVGYAGGTGLNYGLWGIAAGIGNAVFGSWARVASACPKNARCFKQAEDKNHASVF